MFINLSFVMDENSLSCEIGLDCIDSAIDSMSLSSFESQDLLVGVVGSTDDKISDVVEWSPSSVVDFPLDEFFLASSNCCFDSLSWSMDWSDLNLGIRFVFDSHIPKQVRARESTRWVTSNYSSLSSNHIFNLIIMISIRSFILH